MIQDSRTPDGGSTGADDDLGRPPRYDQVIRWAEYITEHPPEVWGPQQNAVVNGQIESAQAADVSAEEKKRIREFARAELAEETGPDTENAERSDAE
ncbi:MAG: hypothetical protein R6U01_11685 [Halorubrum sp.]|uniref:hypothetical protein n=1 Tax=Halorubrum sp. TaxID=1879286 RepID=UPI00397073C4